MILSYITTKTGSESIITDWEMQFKMQFLVFSVYSQMILLYTYSDMGKRMATIMV